MTSFENVDFIVPSVVRSLGVRSLFMFGAVSKPHKTAVSKEVGRRKQRIAAIETEMSLLRPCMHCDGAPVRASIAEAKELEAEAMKLVDDEINFHDQIGAKDSGLEIVDDIIMKFHGHNGLDTDDGGGLSLQHIRSHRQQ